MFENALKKISQVEGEFSFIVKNLRTGETFKHNEDMVFPSASIIKVPILVAVFDEVESGRQNFDLVVEAKEEDMVGGAGVVQYLGKLPYTLLDHAILMTILSDNTSTNKIIDVLGLELIAKKIADIGLKNTVLARKLMLPEALRKGKDNLISGQDILTLFEYIHNNSEKYQHMLKILKQQMLNDLLPALTGFTYDFAHKTGMLSDVRHDVGIMYLDDPIFVSYLSKNLTGGGLDSVRLANELGVLVVDAFKSGKTHEK